MPEISQDNFELLNPSDPPATPQELRARANSSSGVDRRSSAMTGANDSSVNNRIARSISSTTAEEIAQAQSSTRQLRLMSENSSGSASGGECETPTNTFVGFQNDYIFGYKREMTHR